MFDDIDGNVCIPHIGRNRSPNLMKENVMNNAKYN